MCVCVDYGRLWRRSDRPQSNDDHSHMNCNEFQKINYLEMVDTGHSALRHSIAISSRSRTYSKCLFMLPYPSCVCLCVFYYFFTFLLRLIFIGAEQEKQTGPKTTSILLGSTCARIPAHTHTRTHKVMMMVFRLNYLAGPMSIFLLRPQKQNERVTKLLLYTNERRIFEMSRRIND